MKVSFTNLSFCGFANNKCPREKEPRQATIIFYMGATRPAFAHSAEPASIVSASRLTIPLYEVDGYKISLFSPSNPPRQQQVISSRSSGRRRREKEKHFPRFFVCAQTGPASDNYVREFYNGRPRHHARHFARSTSSCRECYKNNLSACEQVKI